METGMNTRALARIGLRAALILCAALGGCGPPEPIRIGFVGSLSGRFSDLGTKGRDGAELAVEQRNAAGGVLGRKILFLPKDDHQDPEAARQAVRDLISQGVSAIIGPMASEMAMATVPVANEAGMLLVSPVVRTETLTGIDDYFFRLTSTTRHFAESNAHYQTRVNRMRRVAAAYDQGNKAYTENWLRSFQDALTQDGGQVIEALGFEMRNKPSLLKLAGDLLADKPDGILIVANAIDSAELCQQIRKLDGSIPIALADWATTDWLPEVGGKAVEGIVASKQFDHGSIAPRYVAFRQVFLQRFHLEPGDAGVLSYEAVNVVIDALAKQKKGQTLKQAVLAIREFEGLQSAFSFDDFGEVKRPAPFLVLLRDGKFVPIE